MHTQNDTVRRQPRQTVQAAEIPDALLTIDTVSALTSLPAEKIRDRAAAGRFPQPAEGSTQWRASDVATWLRKPRKPRQPVQVADVSDALLAIDAVTTLTGLSASCIYRKVAAGQFVQPIRMGTRCTRWRAGDVTAWARAQCNA